MRKALYTLILDIYLELQEKTGGYLLSSLLIIENRNIPGSDFWSLSHVKVRFETEFSYKLSDKVIDCFFKKVKKEVCDKALIKPKKEILKDLKVFHEKEMEGLKKV